MPITIQVSAIDMIEIRKLILVSILNFQIRWRFVDKGYIMPDPTHPWPFEESIQRQYDGTSQTGLDFMGVKIVTQ
jgi:hypothetical protein